MLWLPFHEACVDQQLGQVLADGSTGGAHHEVQDDLPALGGVAVQAADVAGVPIGAQGASFVGPRPPPESRRDAHSINSKTQTPKRRKCWPGRRKRLMVEGSGSEGPKLTLPAGPP